MACKVLAILLLLACSGTFSLVSSASVGGEGEIYEETDVEDPEVGTIHDVREVDYRCRHEKNTNTLPDGSKSTVLDDYKDGKGLVLISNTSDVCLVRDLDQEEKDQANTCKDGMVNRDKDKPDTEEKNYVKSDTELSDEEREALPEPLQAACQGKQIYKLVPKEEDDDSGSDVTGSEDGSLSRDKRFVRFCYRCYYHYYCYLSCRWWGCYRWCRRVIYCRARLCYYFG